MARAALLVLFACLTAGLACDRSTAPGGTATLIVVADVSGTGVATVVVEVTAPDIPSPLVYNIAPIASGVATGAITVPAGSNRTVSLRAYDAGGVETHVGAVTLNIQPGTNPTLSVVLRPLTGDVPITVTLGSVTVAVAPTDITIAVGDTTRLTVAITDWDGTPVSAVVSWATLAPGVATVDGAGLVTGLTAGTTHVSATYKGATGTAAVTVTP
jgi:hypothetical protein